MGPHQAIYFNNEYSVNTNKERNIVENLNRPALHDKIRRNHYECKSFEEFAARIDLGRVSSPGKLQIDEFYNRDHNEIKNDPIMDKYLQRIKDNLRYRFEKQ